MRLWMGWVAVWLVLAVGSPVRADVIMVSYGAAGVQTPSQNVMRNATTIGTETFNIRSTGTFTTAYGTGGAITGTYTGATIRAADQYGGTGGTGNYVDALAGTAGYTISLATSGIPGVNYFGYWLSALDAGNQIVFKHAGVSVGTYSPSDLVAALGTCSGSNPYCGNPTANFRGQDGAEPFAFVNFVDVSGFFDEVDVFEKPSVGNYESDNHTVAYCANQTACVNGTVISEPMSLTIVGAGLACIALLKYRQRRRS